MTADALQQNLLRQEPIDRSTAWSRTISASTDGSGIADQTTQSIGLTPTAFTLGNVTLYTTTASNNNGDADLDTVNPLTGGYRDRRHQRRGACRNRPVVTYGDIAMRPDGELFGITDRRTGSETLAGQYVELDTGEKTGDAATAVSTTSDGILSYEQDVASATTVDAQPTVGFNVNAMAFGPLVRLRGTGRPSSWATARREAPASITPTTCSTNSIDGAAANYPGVSTAPSRA